MPFGASRNPSPFSARVCGAWSVAIMSTVPSAIAAIVACRSCSLLNGGFIFASVPYFRSASSLSAR